MEISYDVKLGMYFFAYTMTKDRLVKLLLSLFHITMCDMRIVVRL